MDLRDVMGDLAAGLPPTEVVALAYDNRKVVPGSVFFCVRGGSADGHAFAPDAVGRGAAALVVDHPLDDVPPDVPQVVVPDVRASMAAAAARFHGDPTATLRVAGITGTNGKTTSAYLLRGVLEATGHRTGLLGTVASVVGGVETATVRTTPEAIDLQRTFAAMRDAGDTHCAIEVSSHALELGRADSVHWAVAVFTNLSQDHLDFHPTMEEYFRAKRRLFATAAAQGAPLVLNVDDAAGRRLAEEFPQAATVAIERDAGLRADRLRIGLDGSRFEAAGVEVRLPLPGAFNVLNALGAVAAAEALGVPREDALRALERVEGVPGRLQPVDEGQPFAVLVDYAHTPDGLENVLRAARGVTAPGGRVLVAFGAGGDRDREKRPLMGRVAAQGADVVVVTSDNPRSEPPEAIVAEVAAGTRGRDDVRSVVDRREAIHLVVAEARPGDVVLIAGKGHEQGQEGPGGVKVPFDDVEVAREALRARLGA